MFSGQAFSGREEIVLCLLVEQFDPFDPVGSWRVSHQNVQNRFEAVFSAFGIMGRIPLAWEGVSLPARFPVYK